MRSMIPEVFTEQDRQEVIAARLIEEELTDLPLFVLQSSYEIISAALRLKDKHDLGNDAFTPSSDGFAFEVRLHSDVKHSLFGNKVGYHRISDAHFLDKHSNVAFKVIWTEEN